jgi:drug/metabolite transporter (DMT)-like permease
VAAADARRFFQSQGGLDTVKLALAFFAIYFIWGSTYLAVHYVVETVPPLLAAATRHTVAGSLLFGWAMLRGFRPTRANWSAGLVVGALFFLIGHGLLHWAQKYVASGLAAVLIATEPMFILVLSWSMGQQQISRLSAGGLVAGVLGVALLAGVRLSVDDSSFLAILAVLASSLAWSLGVVISPKVELPADPLGRTAIPLVCGAALLLIAAGIAGEFHEIELTAVTWKSLLGLTYLIVFGSIIAFTSYTWLLQRCPPALVATHTYANPLVAILLGWLFASEPLTLRVVLGSAVILAAIVLVRRGERSAASRAPEIIATAVEAEPGAIAGLVPLSSGGERS